MKVKKTVYTDIEYTYYIYILEDANENIITNVLYEPEDLEFHIDVKKGKNIERMIYVGKFLHLERWCKKHHIPYYIGKCQESKTFKLEQY